MRISNVVLKRYGVTNYIKDLGTYTKQYATEVWEAKAFKDPPKEQILYDFTDPESIKQFQLITDRDSGGQSCANLTTSKYGRLLFQGNLSKELVDKENFDLAGFAAIRSEPKVGLFNKVELTDTCFYDCIEIKYRGDGRPYFINIQTESFALVDTKHDLFQSILYTKGGPFWQRSRIPFSQFLVTHKGFVQDVQYDCPRIKTLGISLCDKKSGPFRLEVESLKMCWLPWQPPMVSKKDPMKLIQDRRRKDKLLNPVAKSLQKTK